MIDFLAIKLTTCLCCSKIVIYESSSKFGGWIDTKKIEYGDKEVHFEKGPRTLRIATGELKELNSLQMVSSQKI